MVSQSDADTSSHTTGRMRSPKARVQIVGRVSGRRNWTVEQKLAILGEAFASGSSVASFIHGVGNCLTVSLAEFATAIWITDLDLRGLNLHHRAKCPRCHQS